MYSLVDDKTITIKDFEKVGAVIVWHKKDPLKETNKQWEEEKTTWRFQKTFVQLRVLS